MGQISNGDTGAAARALINSVLPNSVAFNATVPLDGNKVMAQKVINAAITFAAPSSPVLGASCYVRMIADGTNIPSFPSSSFVEHGSSAGFLNVNGAINTVEFWYDGTVIYYAINQAANVSPFGAQSAYVPNAAPTTIVITYPYNLNTGSVPAASAFAITASGGAATVSSLAISGRTVTLTLSRSITGGETVSILYTPPGTNMLLDLNGNAVLTSSVNATNGVPPSGSQYLRFPNSIRNVTEAVDAIGGYDYTPTSSAAGNTTTAGCAICAGAIPAGQDGFVQFVMQGAQVTAGVMMGLQTGTTITAFSSITYGIYGDTATTYKPLTNGAVGSALTGLPVYQVGSIIRVSRKSSSTTPIIVAEISQDGGASWTTLNTWSSSVSTAALYPCFFAADYALGTSGLIVRPIGSSNVA